MGAEQSAGVGLFGARGPGMAITVQLTKGADGFGMKLSAEGAVTAYAGAGGPGEAAGIPIGARLVQINGVSVASKKEVVAQLKLAGDGAPVAFTYSLAEPEPEPEPAPAPAPQPAFAPPQPPAAPPAAPPASPPAAADGVPKIAAADVQRGALFHELKKTASNRAPAPALAPPGDDAKRPSVPPHRLCLPLFLHC